MAKAERELLRRIVLEIKQIQYNQKVLKESLELVVKFLDENKIKKERKNDEKRLYKS